MKSVVEGVGPDAPTVVNEAGGKQSGSPYRADLLPALAVLSVAGVLKLGADKYGANNWRAIPSPDHLNHLITHVFAYLAGDTSDDHLSHAATRALFALELHEDAKRATVDAIFAEAADCTSTSYADAKACEPSMPRVYIAGPISSGDLLGNVNQATAAFNELMRLGFAPLCPHWSVYAKPAYRYPITDVVVCVATADGNGMQHEDWIALDYQWVAVSDALLRLPGASRGADLEVNRACELGIPVLYSVEQVRQHFPHVKPRKPMGSSSERTGVAQNPAQSSNNGTGFEQVTCTPKACGCTCGCCASRSK